MDLAAFGDLVESLDGVRAATRDGRRRWEYDGRLVAREVDDTHVVLRAAFDVRDALLQFPAVFSVPTRYAKHQLVVADLAAGDDDAVEDAVRSAWLLQQDP